MKKLIALLTAASLGACMGMNGSAYAAELLSENSEEVAAAAEAGILLGTDKGYELERPVTRAESLMFIWRLTGAAFNDIGYPEPSFGDIEGHWGYDVIEKFVHAGYIDGIGNGMFAPDREVTAREFMKIFLSAENGGSGGITIENVYDKAEAAGYLNNDEVKTAVSENIKLTRSDTVRLCADILDVHNKAEDEFTAGLLAAMHESENYMISPVSVKTAFAMLANGARGETREQLLDAIGIDDLDSFNDSIKKDIERYGSDPAAELKIANSLWLFTDATSRDFLDGYTKTAEEHYGADINRLVSDEALEEINGWVSVNTNGKIKQIADEKEFRDMLDSGAYSALLNAVYFKGAWQNQFDPLQTSKDVFTDRNGDEKEIDFMRDTEYYDYYDGGEFQIIELPYSQYSGESRGELNISMYAMKGSRELAEMERAIGKMSRTRIKLSFPKFKTEYDTGLIDIMRGLGAEYIFDPERSDLGGMYSGDIGGGAADNPYIQYVKHKTYIDVNEEGTEAAAVTGMFAGGAAAATQPPLEVRYDTPFMYIIRDNDTGAVLFAGEYAFAE